MTTDLNKTYSIEINEYQRILLARAILTLELSPLGDQFKHLSGQWDDNALEELQSIRSMFEHMPITEAKMEGIVHSFAV